MLIGSGKIVRFLNGKKLGVIRSDKTFLTFRKKEHFFKIYNGWGINKVLLKELEDIGVEYIEIIVRDEKTVYRTKLINFILNGIEYQNPKNEKDEQIILAKDYFETFPLDKNYARKVREEIKKKKEERKEMLKKKEVNLLNWFGEKNDRKN